MTLENNRKQAWLAWLFVSALAVLSVVFGVLQYKWIGEVSRAEGERLRGSLDSSLHRLSLEFNNMLTTACAAIASGSQGLEPRARHEQYAANFETWRETTPHPQLFRAIAIATPAQGKLSLQMLDFETGAFVPAQWPDDWTRMRDRLAARAFLPLGLADRGLVARLESIIPP